MKLDLSKMHKVHSSKTHTIMEHPDGHTVHIAHSSLKPVDRAKLHALPIKKMAEGGQVSPSESTYEAVKKKRESESQPSSSDDPKKKFEQGMKEAWHLGLAEGTPEEPVQPSPEGGIAGMLANPTPASSVAPEMADSTPIPQVEAPVSNPLADVAAQREQRITGAVSDLGNSLRNQAFIAGDVGRETAQANQQAQQQLQQRQLAYDTERSALNKESADVENYIKENPVAAKKMFHDMGVGERLSTSLGMLIAGLGGNTPENNPVIKMMNQEIDRDLEAQKANLGAKENLLSANLKKLGNLDQAMSLTKANILSSLALKTESIIARSQDPMQIESAKQKLALINIEKDAQLNDVAEQRAIMGQSQAGGLSPETAVNVAVPKEARHEARKALADIRGLDAAREQVSKEFDKLKKLGSVSSGVPYSNSSVAFASAKANIINAVRSSMKGQGALSDQEIETSVLPQIPNKLSSVKQIGTLQKNLENFLLTKRAAPESLLKGFPGVPVPETQGSASADNFGFKAK